MSVNAVIVIASLALVLVIEARRFVSSRPSEFERRLRLGVLIAASLALTWAVYGDVGRRIFTVRDGYIRTWNVFHHYLGAKYFDELGYVDLYACALEADATMVQVWDAGVRVRDLRSYEVGPRSRLRSCPKERFTEERWRDFKADLLFIQQTTVTRPGRPRSANITPERIWPFVLADKGFNASPVWLVAGRWLANAVSLDDPNLLKLLLGLDVILIVASLCLVGRAHGLETALLVFVFLVSFWGSYQRLAGNLLQYTWLSALLIGFASFELRWLKSSAAFFAYAAMSMGFPIYLVSGLLLRLAWSLFAARAASRHPSPRKWIAIPRRFAIRWTGGANGSHARAQGSPPAESGIDRRKEDAMAFTFLIWLLLFCIAFFVYTLVLPHPLETWRAFFENIRLHERYLHGELYSVGLKNLVGSCCDAVYRPGFVHVDRLSDRLPLYYALLLLVFGAFAAQSVWPRNRGADVLASGFLPIFGLLTLSRYYYSGLAIFLLSKRYGHGAFVALVGLNFCFFVAISYGFTSWKSYFYPYWGIEIAYLLFFVVVLGGLAWRRDPPPA